jgi:glycosyltransferase A (GT-A) superfamily protein (DUF2064 family)
MLETLASAPGELHIACDAPGAWDGAGFATALQHGESLGDKILNAVGGALQEGRPAAIVVGSDSPTLPLQHIVSLLQSPADITLGPAEDGGFYAISCRRVTPDMFDGVEWSSAETLAGAVRALERCSLSVALGPPWFDVDRPQDLLRLRAAGMLPRNTRHWMEAHWSAVAHFYPGPS